MLGILRNQPVPIRQKENSIPKPLADLIDLALRDNPDLHFTSAVCEADLCEIAFKNALLSVINVCL